MRQSIFDGLHPKECNKGNLFGSGTSKSIGAPTVSNEDTTTFSTDTESSTTVSSLLTLESDSISNPASL
jgi:hypothetical protein